MYTARNGKHPSWRVRTLATLIATTFGGTACAQVFAYECDTLPEDAQWNVLQVVCGPQLSLDAGNFVQHVELCPGYDPPGGQTAAYGRSLADFEDTARFFLTWRVETDAPRTEIPWGGGAAIAIGGFRGVNYSFYIADDRAKLNRDNRLPIIFADVTSGVSHSYRLELFGANEYVWLIDDRVIDRGIPEGAYPSDPQDTMTWVGRAAWVANTTRWDYIRYGELKPQLVGDVNCDGRFDNFDIDPFVQALVDPESYSVAYPDCPFANRDINADGAFNNFDIDPFVDLLVEP